MPTDVSCPDPDPNEVVTRRILAEELGKELEKFRTELRAELRTDLRAELRTDLSNEFARQLGAYEEKRKLERIQEYKGLLEELRDAIQTIFEVEGKKLLDDHETRITRLEARPAKRARKPAARKPRQPK